MKSHNNKKIKNINNDKINHLKPIFKNKWDIVNYACEILYKKKFIELSPDEIINIFLQYNIY